MSEFKLRDYVPGEAAERERNGLLMAVVMRVVPVGGILFVLVLVAGVLLALSACSGPIEVRRSCEPGTDAPMQLIRLDACGGGVALGAVAVEMWFC